jgi:hypothetical protein
MTAFDGTLTVQINTDTKNEAPPLLERIAKLSLGLP